MSSQSITVKHPLFLFKTNLIFQAKFYQLHLIISLTIQHPHKISPTSTWCWMLLRCNALISWEILPSTCSQTEKLAIINLCCPASFLAVFSWVRTSVFTNLFLWSVNHFNRVCDRFVKRTQVHTEKKKGETLTIQYAKIVNAGIACRSWLLYSHYLSPAP